MKATLILSLMLSSLLIAPQMAAAKVFKNNYITFELPETWACEQAGNEWICTPLDGVKARDAMIVLSAKEAGPEDSFEAYQSYLSKPRILQNNKNIPQPSKIISVQARDINSQRWIQGLHLSSEIPDFYSLYLATVKQGLAVLVSISAEKGKQAQYSPDFGKLIQSIRLTASNELLSAIASRKELNNNTPVGFPTDLDSLEANPEKPLLGLSRELLWGLIAALVIIVTYLGITTFKPRKKKR